MFEDMDVEDWLEIPQLYELMPQGPVQDGLYFGLLASLLYNAHRGKDAREMRPEDWFPHLKRLEGERRQSPRRMRLMMALHAWRARGLPPGRRGADES